MNILILDEEFPYPLNTGKRIRSYNLIKRLAVHHKVHYLAYGKEDSDNFRAMHDAGLHPRAVPPQVPAKSGFLFYIRLFLNLFSRYPYIVSSHYSRVFQKAVHEAVAEITPDIVISEWSPYAIFVKDLRGTRKIIVAHNIEHLIWKRYYENEKWGPRKWYIGKQMTKVMNFELAAFNWVDGAIAVSEIEAASIKELNPKIPVQVVENGVDLEYFRPSPAKTDRHQLIFVGAMNWRPNQDAIQHFVHDILPLIRRKTSDIEAVFVGQDPPPQIKKLGEIPAVKIVGQVDDVRPYVMKAAVYIVPLRIGGGTRLKIVEALAMGKAVVSTSVGAEGLLVTDGKEISLADSPEQFATAVERLLNDGDLRARLGRAGRELVEKHYDWNRLAEKLSLFLCRVAEGR
ncbi:MAG: glycosyltransferase family 4 protein [candidate division Zixibacteria bacterium]|nr:glycosyltransferase family 4 protein [candidate division Zixibacteria bacterium]